MIEPKKVETTDRARGGETKGVAKPVLIASLILIVIAFGTLLVLYR